MFKFIEKKSMKKLVFLMTLFGLMVVFTGSTSAQVKSNVVAPCGPGLFKPVKGQPFRLAAIAPINKNLPKVVYFTIGGEGKDKPVCNVNLQMSQDEIKTYMEKNKHKKGAAEWTGTVKTVNNFPNGIKTSDIGTFVVMNEKTIKVTFNRGDQFLGEIILDAVRAK